MLEPTSESGRKLTALANRLRVLHAELAEQGADMRQDELRNAVQREVGTLPPQARAAFLGELMRQFPVWSAGDGTGASVARAPAPAPETRDPKALAEKLIEASKGLSEADRQAIAGRLAAAGLAPKGAVAPAAAAPVPAPTPAPAPAGPAVTGAVGGNSAAELRRHLGMTADAPLDAGRAVDVAAVLAEFTLKLEPWACTYWRDIAPDAKNQVYQTLNKDLAKYMAGDAKVTKESVARSVHNLRSLISLLLKGVTDSGRQFARDHMSRFSVEEIGKAAGSGSLMTSKDVLCWKQYVRLMEGTDAASIEKRLKSLLAKDVDAGLSQVIK